MKNMFIRALSLGIAVSFSSLAFAGEGTTPPAPPAAAPGAEKAPAAPGTEKAPADAAKETKKKSKAKKAEPAPTPAP